MQIQVFQTKAECGAAAADKAAELLRKAIAAKGHASFITATGASQFEFLDVLTEQGGIDWVKTTMYHLDEYIGFSDDHPASFRGYLKERLVDKVHPGTVHFIQGETEDSKSECKRLNNLISQDKIDVAFVGIGENGHLAFNDPPADFETEIPFIIVELDEACREQQLGEGWFPNLSDVPKQAISTTIKQLMKSKYIVCVVPGKRKAQAVKHCFEDGISPMYPASILRKHADAFVYLDKNSASLLSKESQECAKILK